MHTVPVRARIPTANTGHSLPNDNHSDFKITSSIMMSKSYRKFATLPTGDYSVFFMEGFLSNKDSSDEIIRQFPVGNTVNFAYKIGRHRLYTGCKGCRIIGVSGFRHKRGTNVPNWICFLISWQLIRKQIQRKSITLTYKCLHINPQLFVWHPHSFSIRLSHSIIITSPSPHLKNI